MIFREITSEQDSQNEKKPNCSQNVKKKNSKCTFIIYTTYKKRETLEELQQKLFSKNFEKFRDFRKKC